MSQKPRIESTISNRDVMSGNYDPDADDKVFLTCSVKKRDHGFDVHIDSNGPAIWLDDRYRGIFGGENDLVIHDRSSGNGFVKTQKDHNLNLLSAGVMLWKDDNIVLLKRDEGAPSYPGALTEAAGRCGELPRRTMLKELNEEILISADSNGDRVTIGLCGDKFNESEVRALREKQVARLGVNTKIDIVKVEPNQPDRLDANLARVFLDGKIVDHIQGAHFFDDENLTLEIRQSYRLPEDIAVVEIMDGEPYNRDVFVVAPSSLSSGDLKLVPSLRHFASRYRVMKDEDQPVLKNDEICAHERTQ